MARILELYAGRAGTLATSKGPIRSAIAKSPVPGRALAGADGLAGDEQVHPGHGGPDRAVCLYPREHYAYWAAHVAPGAAHVAPAFGENITSAGVIEEETLIGDVWRIGGALVQVAQPRSPCFKVAARLGIPDLVMRARRSGFTGLHLRVLEPGAIGRGDAIELVERAAHGVSVADAVRARFGAADCGLVAAVLAVPELAAEWRAKTAPRQGPGAANGGHLGDGFNRPGTPPAPNVRQLGL